MPKATVEEGQVSVGLNDGTVKVFVYVRSGREVRFSPTPKSPMEAAALSEAMSRKICENDAALLRAITIQV